MGTAYERLQLAPGSQWDESQSQWPCLGSSIFCRTCTCHGDLSHSLSPQCHWSTYNFYANEKNGNYSMVPTNNCELLFIQRGAGQAHQSQHSIFTSTNRHSTYSMTNGTAMTNSQTRIVQQPATAHSNTEGRMGTMKTTNIQLQQSAWAHPTCIWFSHLCLWNVYIWGPLILSASHFECVLLSTEPRH